VLSCWLRWLVLLLGAAVEVQLGFWGFGEGESLAACKCATGIWLLVLFGAWGEA
jgi:hypothetical protein